MIALFLSNGKIFSWNAQDIYTLRIEYHIIGSLVGCFPDKPFQNLYKWLPLQLMPEEAKLLIDKGIACLNSSPSTLPESSIIDTYLKKRDELCDKQIILFKEERKKTILEKADQIFEGKKRKYFENITGKKNKKIKVDQDSENQTNLNCSLVNEQIENPTNHSMSSEKYSTASQDKIEEAHIIDSNEKNHEQNLVDINKNVSSEKPDEITNKILPSSNDKMQTETLIDFNDKQSIINAELANIPNVSKETCMVQLFTECPWKKISPVTPVWNFPSTQIEKLRYKVFKDLWEKKYYITSGTKFGGDFLVYEGDPVKFHALYIVVCLNSSKTFQAIDLLTYGRLGNQVKKRVLLASLNDLETVEYISLTRFTEIE